MDTPASPADRAGTPPRSSARRMAGKILLHLGCVIVAVGCLAAYEHFSVESRPGASLPWLAAAAGFGFLPLRDVIRVVFKVEGTTLHVVHLLGGLGLVALPLTGVVSGGPVLTHAAMAPFAIMGAAQAVMHQNHPRNAKQAAALRSFAASLPEVAELTGSRSFSSPENARRAVAVLTDIVGKAQALGETELQADPGFQSALGRVSTRFGADLGLDAVDFTLDRLAANPATAGAVPALRKQVAQARRTFAGARRH